MTKALIILSLVALLATAGGNVLLAKDPDEIEKFEEQMKDADEATQLKLIEQLIASQPENEEASKALSKFIRDRSTAVAVAAIRGLGTYKDKKYFGTYMGLLKSSEDDPKRMEATLLSLGELADKRAKKELIDIAKKWLTKNSLVASAAATALGSVPDKASVDELIKLLDLTYPRQSANGPAVSAETGKILKDSRPAIMAGLTALTGWDFSDPRAWQNFWERESKRWKPGASEIDLATAKVWSDPGYAFEITRPADRWIFARLDGARISMSYSEETPDGPLMRASIFVQAYDMKNAQAKTAEQKAQSREDDAKQSYKNIKEESWVRESVKVGKEKGFMHSFTGLSGSGNVLKVKTICVVKDQFMYVVSSWSRSGTPPEVEEEIQKAMDSFELKD